MQVQEPLYTAMEEKSIYVLEDDPDMRSMIRRILMKYNYKVFVFESVEQLNKQLKVGLPDLFILDVSLPDGNGIDVFKGLIKLQNPPPPVLLMSADIINKTKALESGAGNFISKPFRTVDFLCTVENMLAADLSI